MMTTETAPHFDKITRALGDKIGKDVTEDELREQFEKFMEYGVPPEQAVRSIIRQYGDVQATVSTDPNADPVKVEQLQPGLSFVNLLVRVVYVTEREIVARGEPKTIWTGILGDETGTVPFTAWSPFEFDKGAALLIKGAYTKEFNNEVQVNFGDRCEIRETDADAIPEVERAELGVKPIGELSPGGGNVGIKGRILNLEKRQVVARGEEKVITTGTLGDESGKIAFTAWSDLELEEGQVVEVSTGYVKTYRGVPQYNFDDAAEIKVLEDDAVPKATELAVVMPISEIISAGGATDATVRATLLEVRQGSGLVFRCPECNRVLQDGGCRLHGAQEGAPDLRVKAILDDGTGAINAIINRDGTEKLYGKSLDEAKQMAEELMDWQVIEDQLRSQLTGQTFEVTGNAVSDEFGIMLIVNRVTPIEMDVKAEATDLVDRIKTTFGADADAAGGDAE